jgi:hypothetical protein
MGSWTRSSIIDHANVLSLLCAGPADVHAGFRARAINASRLPSEPATVVEAPVPSSSQTALPCVAGRRTRPLFMQRAPAAPSWARQRWVWGGGEGRIPAHDGRWGPEPVWGWTSRWKFPLVGGECSGNQASYNRCLSAKAHANWCGLLAQRAGSQRSTFGPAAMWPGSR